MRVNLCGGDRFMTEHFLHSPQIGATFDQMGGKTVSKSMGWNLFIEPNFLSELLNDGENHDAR